MKLLDLFCCAGGCSVGYERAGFEVTGVDIKPQRHYRGGTFVQDDALEYVAAHGHEFDAIHASPPCQAHSSLRALQPTKDYPDLIPATRAALIATGKPYVIENVSGAPLGGGNSYLLMLCGTMFGLVTPDGRAEIRRHRLFETNWCFGLRPACQHGGRVLCAVGDHPHDARQRHAQRRGSLSVAGHAYEVVTERQQERRGTLGVVGTGLPMLGRREALTVTGQPTHGASYTKAQKARATLCVGGEKAMSGGMSKSRAYLAGRAKTARETFTVDDARAAMGIDWMPMKALSQAIPPAYTEWIGHRLLEQLQA